MIQVNAWTNTGSNKCIRAILNLSLISLNGFLSQQRLHNHLLTCKFLNL